MPRPTRRPAPPCLPLRHYGHARCAASSWPSVALALLPASASAAPPLPFGHLCTAQNGTRFCPTNALTDRVASFDGVPLDVDVTLPASGDGPFPTIVMLHGYGGNKTNYEASKPEGDDPASATTYHWNSNWFARRGYAVVNRVGARVRALLRAARVAHARLRARLDPPRRPALRGARLPAPAGPARRPGHRQAGRARRHRHLLRRRAEPRAGLPARPHPQPGRLVRALAQPARHAAVDHRRLSALAVVGPRQRAAAQRALPRLPRLERDREPRADRRPDPVLPRRALRLRRGVGLLLAVGRRPRRRPLDLVRPHPGRRALRRRRAGDRRRDPRPPPGLRPPGHPGAAAAARRLDRRPLPVLGVAAGLQRAARRRPERAASRSSSPTSATSAAPTRSTPTRRSTTRARRSSTAYLRGVGSPPAPGSVTAFTQTCPKGRVRRRPVTAPRAGPRCTPARSPSAPPRRRRSAPAAATPRPRRPSTRSPAAATRARARRPRPSRAPPPTRASAAAATR